jgi:hypothetical protein
MDHNPSQFAQLVMTKSACCPQILLERLAKTILGTGTPNGYLLYWALKIGTVSLNNPRANWLSSY